MTNISIFIALLTLLILPSNHTPINNNTNGQCQTYLLELADLYQNNRTECTQGYTFSGEGNGNLLAFFG